MLRRHRKILLSQMFFQGFHFNRTVLDLILDILCVLTLLSIVQGKINSRDGLRTPNTTQKFYLPSERRANRRTRVNTVISVGSYNSVDLELLFHKTRKEAQQMNSYIPYNFKAEIKNDRFGYSNKWQSNI